MKFNQNGYNLSTLNENLKNETTKIKKHLGNDFSIKSEGVVDNILVAIAKINQITEEQFAYLLKQFDPNTCEDIYQDALYERVGLYRKQAAPTRFSAVISAAENSTYPEESIIISSKNSNYRFTNENEINTDENGLAEVTFKSILPQDIPLFTDDEFDIIEPESENFSINSITDIVVGNTEESDYEFRKRFFDIKNIAEKCTKNSVIKNLSNYADDIKHLSLQDANSNSNISAGSILITAKPNVSDEIFAKAIMDNTIAGINYLGDTTVNVPLTNGDNWEIKFQKAKDVPVDLYVNIKIKTGYYENSVFKDVKKEILNYAATKVFSLGDIIYGTEFIPVTLNTEGVETVWDIKIKLNSDLNNFEEYIELEYDELPVFSEENIMIEQSNI